MGEQKSAKKSGEIEKKHGNITKMMIIKAKNLVKKPILDQKGIQFR